MSFKVEITEDYTKIKGSTTEVLAGLAVYIRTLLDMNIKETVIKEIVDLALKDEKAEKVIDNDKIKVQKIDLNGLSKEEARDLLDKEIFNKLFD